MPSRLRSLAALVAVTALTLACTGSTDTIFFTWSAAERIDTQDAGSAADPVTVVDSFGNVTAVWTQSTGARTDLWANRFSPSGGWGNAQQIETDNAGSVSAATLHIDSEGNVVALWRQDTGSVVDLRTNRFTYPIGWGSDETIDTEDLGDVLEYTETADSDGNVLVVWRQDDGARHNLWSSRYTAGSGWDAAVLIETDNAGSAGDPALVADDDGNAVAAWIQSNGARNDLWSNGYTVGSGWGTAALIESEDLGDAQTPVLIRQSDATVALWVQSDGTRTNAWTNRKPDGLPFGTAEKIETTDLGNAERPEAVVDNSDRITAIWRQTDGTAFDLWSNTRVDGGWGTAEVIDNATGSVAELRASIDDDGNVLAIWTQSDGTRNDLWANRYRPSSGWSTAEVIDNEELGDALLVADALFDGNGNAIIVFQQEDGTVRNQWANRFTVAFGWGTAEKIETEDGGSTRRAQLVIDRFGHVTAVWRQDDGTRFDQWVQRYTQGVGWGTATRLDSEAGDVQPRALQIDSRGRITVIWPQSNGTKDDLWSARFD